MIDSCVFDCDWVGKDPDTYCPNSGSEWCHQHTMAAPISGIFQLNFCTAWSIFMYSLCLVKSMHTVPLTQVTLMYQTADSLKQGGVTLWASCKTSQTGPVLSAFSSLTLKICSVPLHLRHQNPFWGNTQETQLLFLLDWELTALSSD